VKIYIFSLTFIRPSTHEYVVGFVYVADGRFREL
jgi:hypothetical protein